MGCVSWKNPGLFMQVNIQAFGHSEILRQGRLLPKTLSMQGKREPAWTHAAYHEACHGRPMTAVHFCTHCGYFLRRHS